jgi:DNA repair exonuclease SbcCD ATPase subunit
MNVSAQDVISILSIFVTIVIGVRSFLWSKDYREAKQAELDAKEAGYLAKESEYKSQLETKEERIRFFELIADPKYVDKVEKKFDELKSNIKKLQDTIQQLKIQLTDANNQNEAWKKEIAKLKISDTARSSLMMYTASSSTALNNLSQTTSNLVKVEGNLERNWVEIQEIPTSLKLEEILRDRLIEKYGSYVRTVDESQDDESPSGVEE